MLGQIDLRNTKCILDNGLVIDKTDTLIVGGGQAGLAMSAHLQKCGIEHLIIEKDRIAERWRSARWDSLVMNGPAWHDRFPEMHFDNWHPDSFPNKDAVASYFETFARQINAPIHCGVEVTNVTPSQNGGFEVKTSRGAIKAQNIVAATGPFQTPVIPSIIADDRISQIHSFDYRNPKQLDDGAVLIVGAGSSGSQIADELLRAGRKVYLSIGPHERPPRSYRGKDFVWWLGTLGKWQMKTPPIGKEHVTIAVSGAYGGKTVDFRKFAHRGMKLLGMTKAYANGVITIADGRDAALLRIGPGPRAGGVRAPRAELRLGAPRAAGGRREGAPVRRVGGVRELSTISCIISRTGGAGRGRCGCPRGLALRRKFDIRPLRA